MLKTITFEIETITPMFLAGADQGKAELRAASIKGLHRFWWRTLQAESDIDELRKKEAKIFGSSDEGTCGSSFSIRVVPDGNLKPTKDKFPKQNISVTSKGRTFPVNILEYLAYGTLEYKKGEGNIFLREYIPCGTKFRLHLHFFDNQWKDEILKAMYVFSLFGGLGSRSRNGFGSFNVLNQQTFGNITKKYPLNKLPDLIKPTDYLSYPSFVKGTKLFKSRSHASWDAALAEVGRLYRSIRSGGIKYNGKSFEEKHRYDKRQYIGAPLIVDKQDKSLLNRHAKPYFIKVAKEGNQYSAYILYLPSKYCMELNNAEQHDKKFAEVCNEFNAFLLANMETVL